MSRTKLAGSVLALCALLLFTTATAAARKSRRTVPVRRAYVMTLLFDERHEVASRRGELTLLHYAEEARFTKGAQAFWLVRNGRRGHRTYEIRPAGSAFGSLKLSGPVDYHGLGYTTGAVCTGGACTPCQNNWVLEINGDNTGTATVLLTRNRLVRLELASRAAMTWRSIDRGCNVPLWTLPWAAGPVNSPSDQYSAALPRPLGRLDPREIRFGRPFDIVRVADPISDPSLAREIVNGDTTNTDEWHYRWKLEFEPAQLQGLHAGGTGESTGDAPHRAGGRAAP
jgi:hypothetical protein